MKTTLIRIKNKDLVKLKRKFPKKRSQTNSQYFENTIEEILLEEARERDFEVNEARALQRIKDGDVEIEC